jgi:cyclopropane fatty-acyl-phospholipid synthase-like methyltransferase
MTRSSLSKPWNWDNVPPADWTLVADEFLPVALRWKQSGLQTVLDLGCGRGRHAIFLAELGFSVTAIDLSPQGIDQLIAEAGRRGVAGRIQAQVSDMTTLSFPDESFDAVLGFHAIYHTTYPELKALILTVTRALIHSGQLFVTFNSKDSASFRSASNQRLDEHTILKMAGIEAGIPHTHLDIEEVKALLTGYRIKRLQQIRRYHDIGSSVHFFVEAEKE